MDNFAKIIQQLITRLPELQWQLSKFSNQTIKEAIPHELFNLNENSGSIVATIYQDIENLTQHCQGISGYYLAKKIEQKITILVHLCQIKMPKNRHNFTEPVKKFELDSISTYQQWLDKTQTQLQILAHQKAALEQKIAESRKAQPDLLLNLMRELAVLERTLTQAKESLTMGRFF